MGKIAIILTLALIGCQAPEAGVESKLAQEPIDDGVAVEVVDEAPSYDGSLCLPAALSCDYTRVFDLFGQRVLECAWSSDELGFSWETNTQEVLEGVVAGVADHLANAEHLDFTVVTDFEYNTQDVGLDIVNQNVNSLPAGNVLFIDHVDEEYHYGRAVFLKLADGIDSDYVGTCEAPNAYEITVE